MFNEWCNIRLGLIVSFHVSSLFKYVCCIIAQLHLTSFLESVNSPRNQSVYSLNSVLFIGFIDTSFLENTAAWSSYKVCASGLIVPMIL